MSPVAALNELPELDTVMEDPECDERLTLFAPLVTVQFVLAPPLEVRVIDVGYPEGLYPPKYQNVLGPEIDGSATFAVPPREKNVPALLQTTAPVQLKVCATPGFPALLWLFVNER